MTIDLSNNKIDNSSKPKRAIKSFVRRSGRMTLAQKKGWEHNWKYFGIDVAKGKQAYEQIIANFEKVILEIGYGMGQSLIQMALDQEKTCFIGVEVHKPGVGSLLHAISENPLINNLYTYCADAKEVLSNCITQNSLDGIQVFFPDPWHKKKHNKRRLINAEFINAIILKIKLGGSIHIATDWYEYSEHILEVLTNCKYLTNCSEDNSFIPKPNYRPETKFERRGLALGHGTWDIKFTKTSNPT